jgi:hypothetical protein
LTDDGTMQQPQNETLWQKVRRLQGLPARLTSFDIQLQLAKLRYGDKAARQYMPCQRGYPCHMVNCPPERPTKIDYGNGCCSCSYVKGVDYLNVGPLQAASKAKGGLSIQEIYDYIQQQTGVTYPPPTPPPTTGQTPWSPSTTGQTPWSPSTTGQTPGTGQYPTQQMPPFGPPPIYVMPPVWAAYGVRPPAITPPGAPNPPGGFYDLLGQYIPPGYVSGWV